jgi:hypothetical protein
VPVNYDEKVKMDNPLVDGAQSRRLSELFASLSQSPQAEVQGNGS